MPKVQFRVTDSEYALLKQKAGAQDLSSWLRSLTGLPPARKGRPKSVVPDDPVVEKALVEALTGRRMPSREELEEQMFDKLRCPVAGCDFSAISASARCPFHGRRVS